MVKKLLNTVKILAGNFMAGSFVALPFGVFLDIFQIVNTGGLGIIEFSVYWGATWGFFVTGVALNRKYEFINIDGLFRMMEKITNIDVSPSGEEKAFFPVYIIGYERWMT